MTKTLLPQLVLASTSATRESMLRKAGLEFSVRPPDLDEKATKAELRAQNMAAPALAIALAQAKAAVVAQSLVTAAPPAWIIGADQVLSCDGQLIDKAPDLGSAKAILQRLQGRQHELHAAVCIICHDGLETTVRWRHVSTAQLWMRPLSDEFVTRYLDQAGPSVLWSVGCYQFEGLGAQLFERVEGDYFTILGLPLLPLLNCLRTSGGWPI